MKKILLIICLIFTIACQQEDNIDYATDLLETTIDHNIQSHSNEIESRGWDGHGIKDAGKHMQQNFGRDGYIIYYRQSKQDGSFSITLRNPNGPNTGVPGVTLDEKLDNLDGLTDYDNAHVHQDNLDYIASRGWSVHESKDRGNHIYNGAWREGRTIYHRFYNDGEYTIVLREDGPNTVIEGATLVDKMDRLDELTGYIQEIDYDDPLTYIKMFIADAAEWGYDFGLNGTATILPISGAIGGSIDSCDDGYNIILDDYFWYHDSDNLKKKFLVYHELGHALLLLDHNCPIQGYSPYFGKWIFRYDLMWARHACTEYNVGYFPPQPWESEAALKDSADIMFSLVDQNLKSCETSKGPTNYTCSFGYDAEDHFHDSTKLENQ